MAVPNLNLTAREVMHTQVIAARPETQARDIAFQLLSGLESGLPVIDPHKDVIGVVTEFDLLKALEEGKDLSLVKAEEIMSVPPITVQEETSVQEVLRLMLKDRILSVPVVRKNKLVGSIFRAGILNRLVASELSVSLDID